MILEVFFNLHVNVIFYIINTCKWRKDIKVLTDNNNNNISDHFYLVK